MATGAEWSCPICREVSGDIAYVGSCLHQFCRGCIVRWARKNPSCPLCRQAVHTIIYPAPPDQSFVEMAVPQCSVPRSAGQREALGAAGPQFQPHVAGFPAEMWALFFRNHAEVLRPLELWLNEVLCGACWWDVAFAQGKIVATLCRYGLHGEALVRELQPFLQEQTASFVRQLIEVAAQHCCQLVRRHTCLAPGAAEGQQYTPAASPGTGTAPATSAVRGEPGEEPGPARAEHSGSEGSEPGQSSACGPGPSWHVSRRRTGGSQDASGACTKARHRQD